MAHKVTDYIWAHDEMDPNEPCDTPTPILKPSQWSMLGWTMYRCRNCKCLIRFEGVAEAVR